MYYKRPTKGVFSGQIVAGSGHSFRSFIRVFIRVFRVIRGQIIFAFGSMRAGCPRSDGVRAFRGKKHTHKKHEKHEIHEIREQPQTTNNERIKFSKTKPEHIFQPVGKFRSK